MADAVTPATTPAAPETPAAPPPPDGQEPHWLAGRLERERAKILSDLGVDKAEDAKAALAAYKAQQEASKTELQRAQERAAKLDSTEAQLTASKAALAGYASAELGKLTEAQKAAVVAAAGDDPARQLHILTALRPTWTSTAATTGKAEPAPLPPPATTTAATAAGAPPPGQLAAPNHLATYEQLKSANPIEAAGYYARFQREIVEAKTRAGG